MRSANTREPAFPSTREHPRSSGGLGGMGLRDYFAAKALPICYQYWLTDYYHEDAPDAEERRLEGGRGDFYGDQTLIAESAYEMADAMMKARKQYG